jgi:hypothetical protein
MKTLLALVTLLTVSAASAETSVFLCKDTGARMATTLTVSATKATLGGVFLERDKTYVPGNNNKHYARFIAQDMDVLVPSLMVRNKINQGVVVVYTQNEKIRFSCIK